MEPDPNSLVPGSESGNNQDAKIHTENDGEKEHQQKPAKTFNEIVAYIIPIARFVFTLAIVEAIAIFLEHFSDVFHGVFVELANWCSLCLQLLIIAVLVSKWVESHGKKKKWVWIPYGLICFAMLLAIFIPTKAEPSIVPIVRAARQSDEIEGTRFEREKIENLFPFGYAIIYLNDSDEKQTHEFHNKLLNWKIDWDAVKIVPNFSSNTVTFNFEPNAISPDQSYKIGDFTLRFTTTLKVGSVAAAIPFFFADKPTVYTAVLSDNQRSPVFAVGFRLRGKQDPDYFFIQSN